MMTSTRDFKETVTARAQREPAFVSALVAEAISLFKNGEPETAKQILADLLTASVDAQTLTAELGELRQEAMQALLQIGALDRETMNEIEAACLPDAMPSLLSEQQAADYLNVSVAFLRQQVKAGELVCADQPGGPCLDRNDVVAYKQRMDAQRRQILDELAVQAQELDMGYGVR